MIYMLIGVNDFYDIIKNINTSDRNFIKTICNTSNENPTESVALQLKNEIYSNKKLQQYTGGIALFTDKAIGLVRAIIGASTDYRDIGTYIIGEATPNDTTVSYANTNNPDLAYCVKTSDVIITKFAYENTNNALTKLYDSYIECKRLFKDKVKFEDGMKKWSDWDIWYVTSAICNKNVKLLDRIFSDGATPYLNGKKRFLYLQLAILMGNIDIFKTVLKYSTYTEFTDRAISDIITNSTKLSFIRWYRKEYKRLTKHDIPFNILQYIRSPINFLKYLVTIPWMM